MINTNDCWDSDAHEAVSKYASTLLWRFIQNNARESTAEDTLANLTGLSKRDIRTLADIRFLLSDDVRKFLNGTAPNIISRLSKASITEKVTERNKIRGRIHWPGTYGARASAGGDRSLFMYVKRAQIFDLPENRLFLFVLQRIHNTAKNISSEDFSELTWYSETDIGGKWINRITLIASQTARFLRNPYIARISKLHEMSDKIIEQTKHARASYYRDLADTAEMLAYCQRSPVAFLKEVLKGNILEPLNRDTLFEIAVLFKVINTALELGWKETHAGLIGSSAKSVCTLENGFSMLKVYYQKLPQEFKDNTSYGTLMNEYGLGEKLRRPDIVLSFQYGTITTINYIVEVKRSMRRSYLVDGAYKLLGYLKDFEGLRKIDCGKELRGVLVGWKGIPYIECSPDKEVKMFSWNGLSEGLKSVIRPTVQ